MLKITDGATTLLSEARASAGVPETFGVRFFLTPRDDGEPSNNGQPGEGALQIAFKFVPSPEPADDVVTAEKVPVYVAPEAVEAIGDATLDAQADEGSSRRLVLRR
jgi:hypothetical protein